MTNAAKSMLLAIGVYARVAWFEIAVFLGRSAACFGEDPIAALVMFVAGWFVFRRGSLMLPVALALVN